ncbi:MAG: hypothetical protein U0670_21425, partial [Anaerolineae bacterium]
TSTLQENVQPQIVATLFEPTATPVTPTPFPTIPPITSEDLAPVTVERPDWINFLIGATGVLLVLIIVGAVIRTRRSDRK